MSVSPNIFLFHVHKEAMSAAVRAFNEDWPEAKISNILEDGLFEWVRETGGVVSEMHKAFDTLTEYAVSRGAEGILYSCSAFGECIDACIEKYDLPLLKPNDAMIEKALEYGSKIAIVATVAATIPTIATEIQSIAANQKTPVEFSSYVVDGAFDALAEGNPEKHDNLVAKQVSIISDCDVIVLAQFTLSRSAPILKEVTNIPVLNSPSAAVAKMRYLLNS
ncbi:MAG: arylsulfatase [Rhodospirillaceae bacterium]|nr:arylsulfatase [Rhodospirillaceae bacterium]